MRARILICWLKGLAEAQLRELVEIMDERLMANTEDGYMDRRILFIVNELKYKLEVLEEVLQRLVTRN